MENEGSEILHTRLSRRQTNTDTHAHLYPSHPQIFFITEPGNILFPPRADRICKGPDSIPAPFPGCKMNQGLFAARAETRHRAGNGSGAAGAERRGARAKKAARPSPARPSKAETIATLLPFSCLLYAASVELSHDDLAASKQDLWQYSLLPYQASINLPSAEGRPGTFSTKTPLFLQKSPKDFGRNSRFTLTNGPQKSLCSKVKPSYLWP